jgi:hypothetical protein
VLEQSMVWTKYICSTSAGGIDNTCGHYNCTPEPGNPIQLLNLVSMCIVLDFLKYKYLGIDNLGWAWL